MAKKVGGKRPGAGRKKGSVNKTTAEIRALAQSYGESALFELARMAGLIPVQGAKNGARDGAAESEQVRKDALKEILDRAYGKSPQAVTGDPDNPIEVRFSRIEMVVVDPKT